MKKKIILFLSIVIFITGCSITKPKEDGKINIIATLFPQYDFARQIAGDKANVTLLLNHGVDSHSYDLTPSDIIKINNSDLFIYTGKYMETWASNIIESLEKKDVGVLDVSKKITLFENEQQYNDENNHNDEIAEENNHEKQVLDPHIWTSPKNAKIMVNNILDELIKIDPDNKNYYQKNAENYLLELDIIDNEIEEIVENSKRKLMIFATRFPFYYFVKDYNLEYISAYDSCSHETEPSAKAIATLINNVKEENIPVIYYQELSSLDVANSISRETNTKMLLFHSAHNLTKKEFESGATYLSIMKDNVDNLRIGLN